MPIEPLTPERRRAMTRRHLLDAAAEVFTREGFHGASIDKVAAAAGFTKGAIYSNFKNKDDLFLALLDDRLSRQFALVESIIEDEPPQTPEAQMQRMADFVWPVMDNDDWTLLYLEFVVYAARNPEARARLAESALQSRQLILEIREREYGALGASFDAGEFATISLALFNGLGIDRLIDPESITRSTLGQALAVLYRMSNTVDDAPPPAAKASKRPNPPRPPAG